MADATRRPDLGRPHFVGIGGAGMSSLAKIAAQRGYQVAGSDAKDSAVLDGLRRIGCRVAVGHRAENLGDASCVVVSQAIRDDNPELCAARERGLLVIHRARYLAGLMEGYRSAAIAGTHGKSSTTTMLAVALRELGLDPSFSMGADLDEPGSNGHHGAGDIFVAEADESDRSFHYFRPDVALVLNVEEDHHDNYASIEDHLDSYERFARGVRAGGALVLSADHEGTRELGRRLAIQLPELRLVTYGEADDADVRILAIEPDGFQSTVSLRSLAGEPVTVTMNVPGRHMAHNAVGAVAVGELLGVDASALADGLAHYRGIQRRFTVKGETAGVRVVDSYAHHPTEVAADVATARHVLGEDGRLVVVFQPHLYSRTRALGSELGAALGAADVVVVMSIFGSREDPIPGVSNELVAAAAREHGATVRVVDDRDEVPEAVVSLVRSGDLVLTMGAGDVTTLGPIILRHLAEATARVD